MSRNLRAAILYSEELAWPVFPLHNINHNGNCSCGNAACNSPGKHPRVARGLHDATTNTKIIKEWWRRWPCANIGVVTGTNSGFFVLDVDPRHNGHLSFEYLIDKNGPLPDTVSAKTGSKGNHYLFEYQRGVRNKTNIMPGLDIRGEGGYIVVSPSNHFLGSNYVWELSNHPLETKIEKAPQWLMEMVFQSKEQHNLTKATKWIDTFHGVKEGDRNNSAASLAGYLLRRYIDPDLVTEIMKLWNETRVSPSLSDKELEKVINSIAKLEFKRRNRMNV